MNSFSTPALPNLNLGSTSHTSSTAPAQSTLMHTGAVLSHVPSANGAVRQSSTSHAFDLEYDFTRTSNDATAAAQDISMQNGAASSHVLSTSGTVLDVSSGVPNMQRPRIKYSDRILPSFLPRSSSPGTLPEELLMVYAEAKDKFPQPLPMGFEEVCILTLCSN